MTEKLYYENAYIKDFEATVLSCEKADGGYRILLDKTAFFPEEGGQYSDRGRLGEASVSLTVIENDEIYHITDKPLIVGTSIVGSIDFDERYEKMQCHSAEHILSGLIHSLYGYNNVGFHLGAEDVTMDIDHPLTAEQLAEVERLANDAVYKNVEISVIYPSAEELSVLEYRSKLDLTENVRIVNIGEYDSCACCAPHVRRTGEIGIIKILEFAGLRGGVRIHISAGRRAMRIYNEMQKTLASISHLTSTPKLETADAVARLLEENERVKFELKQFRQRYFAREAEAVEFCEGNALLVYPDASMDELRIIANKATGAVVGILILLSGGDGGYKYILSSGTADLKKEIKNINAALGGKGGGSSNMVQGSFSATLSQIKEYFGV